MIDPAQMAMQMVMIQRQPFDIQYANQQKMYETQLNAWKEIDSAFSSFKSALDDINKADNSFVKNSVTVSEDGYISASADRYAREGSYDIFVEKLAQAQQGTVGFGDGTLPAQGSMTLNIPGEEGEVVINFADFEDIHQLADHVNELEGMTASVVRTDGELNLLLSSEDTGTENSFEVRFDNLSDGSELDYNELSGAQDAVIYLGGEDGLRVTSSNNTFDDVIYGVSFDVTKAQESGDVPITLVVGTDQEASKEAVEEFVDAYNTLMRVLLKHTQTEYQIENDDSDDEDNDYEKITEAGVLASDSTARSIKNTLNNTMRGLYGEGTLYSIGIEANRDGTLKIDGERFEKVLAEEPEKIDALFFGEQGVLNNLEKVIEPYTGSSNSGSNLLKSRQDTLQGNIDRVDDKKERLDYRMEKTYDRYLREYTAMQQVMSQMQSTGSMFMY
ncbi:flagellar filament capping protein FliD [Vibrio agarivorans]|uniref:flagellar filament capping protein FliD n=1 Tax=Vibrio agarivorans TaxID=153622 RepID=UPI002231DCD9|nr:flagellar filament capping protein FliD [Vibrio agarivorans]MDN3662113.1 flagellar filament capping protein FliD [Vibrio agarivorans]